MKYLFLILLLASCVKEMPTPKKKCTCDPPQRVYTDSTKQVFHG